MLLLLFLLMRAVRRVRRSRGGEGGLGLFCSVRSCSASCIVGPLGVMGWWAFGFGPVLVDNFFYRVFGAHFFLSSEISGKNPKIRKLKGRKKRKTQRLKKPPKQKGQKIMENGKTKKRNLGGVLIQCFGSALWFGSFLLVSSFDAAGRCRFPASRFDIRGVALWCRGLMLCFCPFFRGRRLVHGLVQFFGVVVRFRGPVPWFWLVLGVAVRCRGLVLFSAVTVRRRGLVLFPGVAVPFSGFQVL